MNAHQIFEVISFQDTSETIIIKANQTRSIYIQNVTWLNLL